MSTCGIEEKLKMLPANRKKGRGKAKNNQLGISHSGRGSVTIFGINMSARGKRQTLACKMPSHLSSDENTFHMCSGF